MKLVSTITLMMISWFTMAAFAILFCMCVFLWQAEGMLWYGIGLIVSGVCTNLSVKWFMKE